MGLFAEDPATIEAGAAALRIISAGFIVSAVSVTSSGALEGLGMGTPSLIISLFRCTVVIIPVAFILSRFFGVYGVWNAFWVSEVVARHHIRDRLPPLRDGKGDRAQRNLTAKI